MEFRVEIDEDLEIVRVVASGEIDRSEGAEIITVARRRAAERHFDVLYDVRETRTKVPLSEWFHLPRNLEVLKDPATRHIRAAVVASKSEAEAYRFYETVANNVGLSVRVFFDEESAIRWLAEQRPGR